VAAGFPKASHKGKHAVEIGCTVICLSRRCATPEDRRTIEFLIGRSCPELLNAATSPWQKFKCNQVIHIKRRLSGSLVQHDQAAHMTQYRNLIDVVSDRTLADTNKNHDRLPNWPLSRISGLRPRTSQSVSRGLQSRSAHPASAVGSTGPLKNRNETVKLRNAVLD
jgi:hypothetical protein